MFVQSTFRTVYQNQIEILNLPQQFPFIYAMLGEGKIARYQKNNAALIKKLAEAQLNLYKANVVSEEASTPDNPNPQFKRDEKGNIVFISSEHEERFNKEWEVLMNTECTIEI